MSPDAWVRSWGADRMGILVLTLFVALGPPHPLVSQEAPQDSTASADSLAAPVPVEELSATRAQQDEETRASLQAIFDRVESLDRLDVTVVAGIVTISGTADDLGAADRAVELASSQPGVLWVEDEIQLDSSLRRQIEPTWDRLRDLGVSLVARLPLFVVALLIVGIALFVGSVVGRWGGPSFLRVRNPFLRNVIGRALQTAVVLAGVIVALDLLDATALVGAIAGTAGLAGLAIGFAFKDIVENYLAGLLLALRQPFSKNDHIVVESYNGKVVRLTPRETILMTLDGNHVRVPNAVVFRSAMLNYTRNPLRRFDFEVGVGPVDDLALARREGVEVLKDMDGVLDDPAPEALVVALGDSWVTVRFLGWVDQEEASFAKVRSEAIRLVKRRLEDAGISLPSPEYLVRLVDDDGAPSEDPRIPTPTSGGSKPRGSDHPEAAQEDVSPDRSVERQIEDERRGSSEEDLLEGE